MKIAFFVGSIGDTDLAKATIAKLIEQQFVDSIFVIPLTAVATKRTEDLVGKGRITLLTLQTLVSQAATPSNKLLSHDELEKINQYIHTNQITRAYIGVSSTDEEIPYQIAGHVTIPCTIANEYMFKADKHCFWNYVNALSSKDNCDFAVPLNSAKMNILSVNSQARVNTIGHLSIDRSQTQATTDTAAIKKSLGVDTANEMIFLSGTTQPIEIDDRFLDALLSEISTGNYPHIQLRFGMHPGIKEPDLYLQALLSTCDKYPNAHVKNQFKIMLTTPMKARITNSGLINHDCILQCDVSGPDAAQAAEKIGQSVPGALLNEAALMGKPSYFHDKSTTPYLPTTWFANSIGSFFNSKPQGSHSYSELGLNESAPSCMAKLLAR